MHKFPLLLLLCSAAAVTGSSVSCGIDPRQPRANVVKHCDTHVSHVPRAHLGLRLRGGEDQLDAKLVKRLEELVNYEPVMLFMKGTPEQPQCGFSSKITAILNEKGIQYSTFNILEDDEVRQGLKVHSKWPTYPQLYAQGRLVGGLDVVKELVENGELEQELGVKDAAAEEVTGPSTPQHLEDKITKALKAELVSVQDLSDGCGSKFFALVVAEMFEGMPLIDRQRAVHEAIKSEMKVIHALTLKCKTPQQAKDMLDADNASEK